MTPDRTRRLTRLAALAAALIVAACTPTGSAEPTPPPATQTATPTPTPSKPPTTPPTTNTTPASPTPPDQDTPRPTDTELIRLVNAYRNITLDLPPMPPDRAAQHIADATAELTTPNGTARSRMDDVIDDTGLIVRGRPYTTILDPPSPDGPEWTVTGCIATRARTTQIATGATTDDEGFTSDYTQVDLRVAPADNGTWLLAEYTPDQEQLCVPPDMQTMLAARWVEVRTALSTWASEGQPAGDIRGLREHVTPGHLKRLEQSAGTTTLTVDADTEVAFGFEVYLAFPNRARTRWCLDYSRDPTARSTETATGEVTDLSEQRKLVVTATWSRSGGVWKQGVTNVDLPAQQESGPCA